jgi:hypothetical protein
MHSVSFHNGIILDQTAVTALYNSGSGRKPEYNYKLNRPYPAGHLIEVFGLRETSGNRYGLKKGYVATNTSVGSDTGIRNQYCAKTSTSGQYLSIPTSEYDFAALWSTMCWTIAIWLKSSQTARESVMGGIDGSSNGLRIERNDTANGDLRVLFNETVQIITDGSIFDDGEWHRIVLTCSNDCLKLYNDNSLLAQKLTPTAITDANVAFNLFGYNNNGSSAGPAGVLSLQEFVVLDVPVDETFIRADYENGDGWLYKYDNVP